MAPHHSHGILAVALAALVGASASAEPDYEYTTDWVSDDAKVWIKYLEPLVGKPGVRGLEVGSYEGRSAIWFLDNVLTADDAKMVCVDVFLDAPIEARFDANIEASGRAAKVRKIKGDSKFVLRRMKPFSYDFIYIDGCHAASCILADAVLSWLILKPGGVLIFDDYGEFSTWRVSSRPKTAIDAFVQIFADQLEVLHEDDSTYVVRRKLADPE